MMRPQARACPPTALGAGLARQYADMRLSLKTPRKNHPRRHRNRPTAASVGSSGRWAPHRRPDADPRYRPPGLRGVAFHVLSSAEAALGAGFDLERIGLRAVRDSAPSLTLELKGFSCAKVVHEGGRR
jgi:hypothetical protein